METYHTPHLNIKLTTMTSQEILKASMLDILFENRNKQYGAYPLRKFYASRMGLALAISLSSVLLVFLLLPSGSTSEAAYLQDPQVVELSEVDITPPEVRQPEPSASQPPANTQAATVDYQNFQIVKDFLADPSLPTVDDIATAVISNTTSDGEPTTAQHTPQPQALGNGDAAAPTATPEPAVFDPIEKQPEFPGGVEAWRNFLSRHLQSPDELAPGERRTVQVQFMVNASGQVTDFNIVQSAGTSFDREVIRVLKKMPKWRPATQNGHEIAVSFVQPVTFQGVEE
jgi:protein TonB